eukprot:s238_g21.t1
MPLVDLTFHVEKPKGLAMRETLRELCDTPRDDASWEMLWCDKRRRLRQVLNFAEARAQQQQVRCLTDEYQIKRFNYLLYMLVHWPIAWAELPDGGSLTIRCFAEDWSTSGSSAEIREDDLEETKEDACRHALEDLERLRAITCLPEASWIETARRHVDKIVREQNVAVVG